MIDFSSFRVYLRALELEDYKRIHEIRSEQDVIAGYSKYNTYASSENDKKWVESRIFNKEEVTCAICLKETDELIGVVFLLDIDMHNRVGHCPVFIDKAYWGKGYGTEVRMLILKYAFYERGLNRIYACVNEDNVGSIKMLQKCGFVVEGKMRKSHFSNGDYKDQYVLGCLKEDFDKIIE